MRLTMAPEEDDSADRVCRMEMMLGKIGKDGMTALKTEQYFLCLKNWNPGMQMTRRPVNVIAENLRNLGALPGHCQCAGK